MSAIDRHESMYPNRGSRQWSPANDLCAVVHDDANDNIFEADGTTAVVANGFEVAVSGAVKVTTAAGRDIVIPATHVIAGKIFPLRVRRIWATGTTATGILAYL